jgi:chemotaxis protein MotB
MSENFDENASLIVLTRKVNVIVDRHSGAWKIAYADFVTAMMAFFLLLWLLNAATGSQAVGIGDYFSPAVDKEHDSQLSQILEGLTFDPDNVLTSITGTPSTSTDTPNLGGEERGQKEGKSRSVEDLKNFNRANLPDTDIPDTEQLGEGSGHVLSLLSKNPQLQERKNSYTVEDTPEGTRLHILIPNVDNTFTSRFSTEISDETKRQFAVTLSLLTKIDNNIIISGHTDNLKGWPNNIDKWDVSLQRALTAFDWLLFLGFPEERVIRVEGLADTLPIRLPINVNPLQNNHISFLLAKKKSNPPPTVTLFDRGSLLSNSP